MFKKLTIDIMSVLHKYGISKLKEDYVYVMLDLMEHNQGVVQCHVNSSIFGIDSCLVELLWLVTHSSQV